MRYFNIDFTDLSNSKKDDIRASLWQNVELQLSLEDKEIDTLKVAKMVDEMIDKTFNCRAEVNSNVEEVI